MKKRCASLLSALGLFGLSAPLLLGGCGVEGDADAIAASSAAVCVPPPPVAVDPRRSLAVTDLSIVNDARFSFQRVMQQLVTSAGASNSALDVYSRLFDSNNPAPGFVAGAQHCNDARDPSGSPAINSYAITCPRQEGALAGPGRNPFCVGAGCDPYIPIALTNRFDLAPADGSHCGEYRIIFGKRSAAAAPAPNNRNLIIFEAVLPNPNPSCGLQACRPVADFWASLSTMANPVDRANALERFYFSGLPGFAPVIQAAHYSSGAGQIRTNQFMTAVAGQPWQLQEHKLVLPAAACATCTLGTQRVTVKTNPFAALFNPASARPEAVSFQSALSTTGFVSQVPNLATNNINTFFMSINDTFNGGQSTEAPGLDSDYPAQFGAAPSPFRTAIRAKLASIGSALTPANIVDRAQTQSCAGCHQLSNNRNLGGGLVWPPSLGFVHISEVQQELCNGGPCWTLSPALKNVFLPARKQTLETFLNTTACLTCGASITARAAGPAPLPARVH